MRVGAIEQAAIGQTGGMPRDVAPAEAEHDTASRALVVVAPVAPHRPPANYRQAAFLAHLIATRELLPQTRERRQVGPAEAIAAYRNSAALTGRH